MKKVLLYGDSNTWGHNPVDCSKLPRTWGEVAQELLPECDITIDGECGRATLWGEGPKHGIACFRERYFVKKHDFDLIVIMLGTNDLLIQLQYEPERTAQALRQYIRETRVVYGDKTPKFLIISPILVREECLNHPIFSELYSKKSVDDSKRFAEVISKMAAEEGAYFMNAADYAKASDIDGSHMVVEEHEKLGHAAAAKIKEIFDL